MDAWKTQKVSQGASQGILLRLPPQLTVAQAGTCYQELLTGLEHNDFIVLNMAGLEEISFAVLQLLYSASVTAKAMQKEVSVLEPFPEVFSEALEVSGFEKLTWITSVSGLETPNP